jgi:hypothetical protein
MAGWCRSRARSAIPHSTELFRNGEASKRPDAGTALKKAGRRALHQFREFAAMFLYLWLLFALFAVYKNVVRIEYPLNYPSQSLAFASAFVLAKVMLIGAGKRSRSLFLARRPEITRRLFRWRTASPRSSQNATAAVGSRSQDRGIQATIGKILVAPNVADIADVVGNRGVIGAA